MSTPAPPVVVDAVSGIIGGVGGSSACADDDQAENVRIAKVPSKKSRNHVGFRSICASFTGLVRFSGCRIAWKLLAESNRIGTKLVVWSFGYFDASSSEARSTYKA